MSRKIAVIIALITLLFAVNVQGPIARVMVEASQKGDHQSQVAYAARGVETLWSDLPDEIVNVPRREREVPIGYGVDIEELSELKRQPLARSQDMGPAIEVDSTIFEPMSPDPIYLLKNFEGPDDFDGGGMRPPDPHLGLA